LPTKRLSINITKQLFIMTTNFRNICMRFIFLALVTLSLTDPLLAANNGSFAVCPCVNVYAGVPGNCPSMEPLAMAVYHTGPSVAYNTSRSMSLFLRDGNGYLESVSQMAPNATSWGSANWQNLKGSLNSDPVAISRKGSNLEVFYIGFDEAVWHIRQLPGSTKWGGHAIIGGAVGGQVTVAYIPASDSVQLFYKGDNQSLMTITENNGSWGKPVALLPAGSVASNVASIDVGGNRYLFFRGNDGSLKIVSLMPGSTMASAPAALTPPWTVDSNLTPILDASGNIIVFYRGPDYALWKVSSAGSTGWERPLSLGGRASSDLYATLLPGKQIRVYYRATDGGVYYVQQDKGTTVGWSKHKHLLGVSASVKNSSGATLLSQTLFSNPVTGINPDGRQEVFYIGSEGAPWHMWETAASSSGQPYPVWTSQAALGGVGSAPRGNSIIATAITSANPIASYTALDAATIYDIIGNAPFFETCSTFPTPTIGFNHPLPDCNNVPMISRAMGIALLIDDIQTAIASVKASTTGSVTQAQFDALIKAQLTKMGIL